MVWFLSTGRNMFAIVAGTLVAAVAAVAPRPGSLAGVEGGSALGGAGAGGIASGYRTVGAVPAGLPSLEDPTAILGRPGVLRMMVSPTVVIVVLGFVETIAVGKAFAAKNGCVRGIRPAIRHHCPPLPGPPRIDAATVSRRPPPACADM